MFLELEGSKMSARVPYMGHSERIESIANKPLSVELEGQEQHWMLGVYFLVEKSSAFIRRMSDFSTKFPYSRRVQSGLDGGK